MLTEEQLAAVNTEHPLSSVHAGAGSGKTTLIVERALELIERGISHEKIIILTFSRKAAQELKDRLGGAGRMMQIGTFHSVILSMMARKGETPTVLDSAETEGMLMEVAVMSGLAVQSEGGVKFRKKGNSLTSIRKAIEAQSDRGLVRMYKSLMAIRGDIDYAGIMHRGIELAHTLRGMHVIVDEAQDNDSLQWEFVRLVSGVASVMVVGDSNQCIHAWRGARPEEFEALDWPTFPLTETFRCPEKISALANQIQHITVKLRTKKPGGTIITRGDTESLVKRAVKQFEVKDIAVLCRYNAQADAWASTLAACGLPVARKEPEVRGPIFWLLRYLSSPGSVTGRNKAAHELRPYLKLSTTNLWHTVCSGMDTSSACQITRQWMAQLGINYGPAEALAAMDIPYALEPEARRYALAYQGETFDYFRRSEAEGLTYTAPLDITIATLHAAKGLEWPCVIIPELSGKPSVDECRLFYVGTTRAMDTLIFPDGSNWQGYLGNTNEGLT